VRVRGKEILNKEKKSYGNGELRILENPPKLRSMEKEREAMHCFLFGCDFRNNVREKIDYGRLS
jgi:hypothetical protein